MDKISPSVRKLLAVSLLVLPLLFLLNFIVLPLYDAYQANQIAIQDKRILLSRYQNVIKSAPSLSEIKPNSQNQPNSQNFLRDKNETLALAKLQAKLKQIISSNGGNVRIARPLANNETDAIPFIGVNVDFTGTHRQLQRIIYQIETGLPFLFIEKAELRSGQFQRRFDEFRASRLQVRLDVYAALQKNITPE